MTDIIGSRPDTLGGPDILGKNIKYSQEYFEEIYHDGFELFKKHNSEINLFGLDLEINIKHYTDAQEKGVLKIFTLRDMDRKVSNDRGTPVGYCSFFLFNHSHHLKGVHAKQDAFYVDKEYRSKGLGKTLLCYADAQLKKMDVKFIHQCVPECNNWSALLKEMGYKKIEEIYLKKI